MHIFAYWQEIGKFRDIRLHWQVLGLKLVDPKIVLKDSVTKYSSKKQEISNDKQVNNK